MESFLSGAFPLYSETTVAKNKFRSSSQKGGTDCRTNDAQCEGVICYPESFRSERA